MEHDHSVPGGVYLCQVSPSVSCGACCGLYNFDTATLQTLPQLLVQRTEAFSLVYRGVEDIIEFKAFVESREPRYKPYPRFHRCPYIGLIGRNRSRVGCLLHPLADGNSGIDYRGLSYYGGMACRDYFCASTKKMPIRYKQIIRTVVSDWYTYGLVVTEKNLLVALFKHFEKMLGCRLRPDVVAADRHKRDAIRLLLELKFQWPHRPPDYDTPVNYFFVDGRYRKPRIDYQRLEMSQSSNYHRILQELVTACDSRKVLRKAERWLAAYLERAAALWRQN